MSGALKRFRFMAILAGVMSLLLWFVDLPIVHLFKIEEWKSEVSWIPIVHGYVYPFYVLTAIQFSIKSRYDIKKMIFFILAGTLPVASFLAERKALQESHQK